MDEKTKQFAIILAMVTVVVIALYYIFSPYQNCARGDGWFSEWHYDGYCITKTSW